MGKGPAGPFPVGLRASILISASNNPVPWEKRAPDTHSGTGQGLSFTNMPKSCCQQLCPHQQLGGTGKDPSYDFGTTRLPEHIHPPVRGCSGMERKRLRSLKSSSARCSTRERCRPELHTGHILPSQGLREDFPFLTPAPGHSNHPDPSQRAHPVLRGDARASLPGAVGVGSPSPGVAMCRSDAKGRLFPAR